MTPLQTNCLKIALKSGNLSLACRIALLVEVQSSGNVIHADAFQHVKHAMTAAQWAGCLSGLSKSGFYTQNHDKDYAAWGHINSEKE